MPGNDVQLDLTPLSLVESAVAQLRAGRWEVTDRVGSVEVVLDPAPDPAKALTELDPLVPSALSVQAEGTRDGARLVVRLVNGQPEVMEPLAGDPRDLFDDRQDWDRAAAASDGDVEAALRLPMQWRVHATFSLARLVDCPSSVSLTVCLSAKKVTQHVTQIQAGNVQRLWPDKREHNVLVALDATDTVQCGSLVLTGVPKDSSAQEISLSPVRVLPGEQTDGPLVPPGALLADPSTAIPEVWAEAVSHARVLAAQLVWRILATSEADSAGHISLTFFGFKRAVFELPDVASWAPKHVEDTLNLRKWAMQDASPDRFLSVRQVVSLQNPAEAPFENATDVKASAEAIYVGLRTDQVAEAVRSSRDAHNQAMDAARQSARNATDMVKATTERMLASLVAVGAVLVANAGQVLPDDTSRMLILLTVVFLLALAASSTFLEAPLLSLTTKRLKQDLDHQAGLLTKEQRKTVASLPSLLAAQRRVSIIRWTVPCVYILLSILFILFGHPGRY